LVEPVTRKKLYKKSTGIRHKNQFRVWKTNFVLLWLEQSSALVLENLVPKMVTNCDQNCSEHSNYGSNYLNKFFILLFFIFHFFLNYIGKNFHDMIWVKFVNRRQQLHWIHKYVV
jgi:hypothetical protein